MESDGVKLLRAMVREMKRTLETVESYFEKKGLMEKISASGKIDPSDPEQEFYIRHFMALGELVTRLKLYLDYIEKPIQTEGKLKVTTSGAIMLGDRILKTGAPFEFMVNNRWELGTLQKNPLTNQFTVFGPKMDEFRVELNGLPARIRG